MASLHSQYQVHNLPAGYKLSKANCKPAASKPGPKCQFVAETVFLDAAVNGDVAGKFPQQLGRTLQYFGLNGGEGEGTMNRCSSALHSWGWAPSPFKFSPRLAFRRLFPFCSGSYPAGFLCILILIQKYIYISPPPTSPILSPFYNRHTNTHAHAHAHRCKRPARGRRGHTGIRCRWDDGVAQGVLGELPAHRLCVGFKGC